MCSIKRIEYFTTYLSGNWKEKHEGCSLRRNYVKRISGKLSGECSKQNYEMMCYGLIWHKNTKERLS